MKIRLHYKDEDYIDLEADTIEEIKEEGLKEVAKRGWAEEDCWSEEI